MFNFQNSNRLVFFFFFSLPFFTESVNNCRESVYHSVQTVLLAALSSILYVIVKLPLLRLFFFFVKICFRRNVFYVRLLLPAFCRQKKKKTENEIKHATSVFGIRIRGVSCERVQFRKSRRRNEVTYSYPASGSHGGYYGKLCNVLVITLPLLLYYVFNDDYYNSL